MLNVMIKELQYENDILREALQLQEDALNAAKDVIKFYQAQLEDNQTCH